MGRSNGRKSAALTVLLEKIARVWNREGKSHAGNERDAQAQMHGYGIWYLRRRACSGRLCQCRNSAPQLAERVFHH